jgi:hypothetical protein
MPTIQSGPQNWIDIYTLNDFLHYYFMNLLLMFMGTGIVRTVDARRLQWTGYASQGRKEINKEG